MTSLAARFTFVALLVVQVVPYAQAQPLPSQIKGRWTYQGRLSNTFTLSEIKVAADGTFSAKLEWWTSNPSCTIKDDSVSGRASDNGIAWDYVTKPPCNVPYVVELTRKGKGWEGTATSKDGKVVAEVKAE